MPAHKNQADACVPGPGTYDSLKALGATLKNFTIGPRTIFNDIEHIEKNKGIPGPGHYEDIL